MRASEPLTRDELERLWRWERQMVRFHAVAMTLLVLCAAAAYLYSDIAWMRRSLLVFVGALDRRGDSSASARKVPPLRRAAAHQIATAPAR